MTGWWSWLTAVPFRDRGRGPDGADCWGLAMLVYGHHLGIALEDRPGLSSHDPAGVRAAAMRGLSQGSWNRVQAGREAPFDLAVVWRPYRSTSGGLGIGPIHCGVVTRPGRLIHCDPDCGTTEIAYAPEPHLTLQSRRIEFFRHRECLPRGAAP